MRYLKCHRSSIAILLSCICGASLADNQSITATTLKDKYLQFRGGTLALTQLDVVERSGSVTVFGPNGQTKGTYHTCVHYPDHVAIRIDAQQAQVAQYLSIDGGFVCTGNFEKCQKADEVTLNDLKATALTANREMLYSKEDWAKGAVLLLGQGLMKVTFPTSYYIFDSNTGKLEEQGGVGHRSRKYGDWRIVNGARFPFTIRDYYDNQPRFFESLESVTSTGALSTWCSARIK